MNTILENLSGENDLVLCATGRLTQTLRKEYDRLCVTRGLNQWRSLNCKTIDQWLAEVGEEMALKATGRVSVIEYTPLDSLAEHLIWERAILETLEGNQKYLLDVKSMARTASQAHDLLVTWQIKECAERRSDESLHFEQWRKRFLTICKELGYVDRASLKRAVSTKLASLSPRELDLPARVFFAGFDRFNPVDQAIQAALTGLQIEVGELAITGEEALARALSYPDATSEILAAAIWAKDFIEQKPEASIAIVVPDLASKGDMIHDALQDILAPASMYPSQSETPMPFNLSLGRPLENYPLVGTAIDLLELVVSSRAFEQSKLGSLLRSPYWSASLSELAQRAVVDSGLRSVAAPKASLSEFLRAMTYLTREMGESVGKMRAHLSAMKQVSAELSGKALPSTWGQVFVDALSKMGWHDERPLSSHEYQAKMAFMGEVRRLSNLDRILGEVSAADSLAKLRDMCRERVFQPKTEGNPPVQVLGILEASGLNFDAVWVTGMTDTAWPPPASPNPLLSAEAQRRVQSPHSCATVQLNFARNLQNRLNQSTREIVFSWPSGENGAELRMSPLIAHFAQEAHGRPVRPHWIDTLIRADVQRMAPPIEDETAPPVQSDEEVRGGTQLLRTQAICPAWAYFQFRLGAKKLEAPTAGLDNRKRGTLIHAALENFWRKIKTSRRLHELDQAGIDREILEAVELALKAHDENPRNTPLKAHYRGLESARLIKLMQGWLSLELARKPEFEVIALENSPPVNIGGIEVAIQPDRVDLLEAGLLVIDYKTGNPPDTKNWASERITEPQLPIYAAIPEYTDGKVIGVAFAKVKLGQFGITGLGGQDELMPKLPAFDSSTLRKRYPEKTYACWDDILKSWNSRLHAIANEIQRGEASVRFTNEKELEYCDVLPLLRLSEYKAQLLEIHHQTGGRQ